MCMIRGDNIKEFVHRFGSQAALPVPAATRPLLLSSLRKLDRIPSLPLKHLDKNCMIGQSDLLI